MATIENKVEQHRHICAEVNTTFAQKNHDYGDSFSKARHVIPNYTLGKLYDKFQRYMTLDKSTIQAYMVSETIEDTLLDMANYCIMEVLERRLDAHEMTQNENSVQSIRQQDQQAPTGICSGSTPISDSSGCTRTDQCTAVCQE